VAREPSYAPAQAALGKALLEQAISGWTEFPADAIAEAERAAQAALTADPGNAPAMAVLANVHLTRKQFDLALAEVDRALQLNPSDAEAYSVRGDILTWAGDHAGAIEAVQAAQKLNPALGYGQLGWCYYLEGRYREAIAMLTHAVASDHSPLSRDSNTALLAASYAQLGETEAAAEARSRLARYSPFFDPEFFVSQFGSAADRERLREGLGKAGIGPANQHKTE
jgi:tetratricopeptide (TPR) repeat protein